MVTYMSDKKIQTLDDIRTFLEGTDEVEFSIGYKDECTDGSGRHWCGSGILPVAGLSAGWCCAT